MAKNNGKSVISRFIGSKNTVTILGVLACIATLVIGFNYRVNQSSASVLVPYAKKDIPAKTLITDDMVGRIRVTTSYASTATNLVKTPEEVIGKYGSYKTDIPQGSLFFNNQIIEADALPDAAFKQIDDDATIFSLAVNEETTLSNSIRAGEYIDLYMYTTDPDNDNKVIYAKLIESIRVLAVKDDKGVNIIKNGIKYGIPSELLFAVPNDMFLILEYSQYVGDVTVYPVIRNTGYTANKGDTLVSSEELVAFLKSRVSTTIGIEEGE